jgi:hypothetical protein
MTGRLPSITEPDDFAVLVYALENDGALPILSEYVRDALVTARWVTGDGKLNADGLAVARKWVGIRQASAAGFRPGGAFTPRTGQK